MHENKKRAVLFGSLMLLGLLAAPASNADHIRTMIVYQSDVNNLQVTLNVDFNPTGNCCGGLFYLYPDDATSNSGRHLELYDGFSSGNYQGDITSWTSGTMTNNDPYEWRREGLGGVGTDPDLVRIQIRYSYPVGGTYTGHWNDCCITSFNTVVVTTGSNALTPARILALDNIGSTQMRDALDAAGVPDCVLGPAPRCYEPYDAAGFAPLVGGPDLHRTTTSSADTGYYKVVMVTSSMDAVTRTALTARAQDLTDFAAFGGGIVVYGQSDSSAWSWLPGGSTLAATVGTSDSVSVTTKGRAHPSHLNSVDATLSNWNWSAYNGFTSWPSFMGTASTSEALSTTVLGGSTVGVSLAGDYSGRGCVFVSGQPADEVTNRPASATTRGIDAHEGALMLLRSSLEYAFQC